MTSTKIENAMASYQTLESAINEKTREGVVWNKNLKEFLEAWSTFSTHLENFLKLEKGGML